MGIFPHDFFAHKCCYKTHTQHITYETCVYCIWPAKFLARVFTHVCFFVENNLFFLGEKKVPYSCIISLSIKQESIGDGSLHYVCIQENRFHHWMMMHSGPKISKKVAPCIIGQASSIVSSYYLVNSYIARSF